MKVFPNSILVAVVFTLFSCGSSETSTSYSDAVATSEAEPLSSEASITTESKVDFEPFNNIDEVRQKLSSVGIGNLRTWKDDGMGGYMSITPYYDFGGGNYDFGGGNLPNNLAYYLESDTYNSIKTLKLVLNINRGSKKAALSKFSEIVKKTYDALDMTPTNKIMNAARNGKEVEVEKETHTEKIQLVKSRIETWKFIIETK